MAEILILDKKVASLLINDTKRWNDDIHVKFYICELILFNKLLII